MIQLKINDDDIQSFESLRKGNIGGLAFALSSDGTALELVNKFEKNADYAAILDILPKNDSLFVFWDFHYETDEKPPRKTVKLIMISWCPETVNIRKRFPFAAAKDGIKNAFTGIQKEIQAGDYADVEYESVRKELL